MGRRRSPVHDRDIERGRVAQKVHVAHCSDVRNQQRKTHSNFNERLYSYGFPHAKALEGNGDLLSTCTLPLEGGAHFDSIIPLLTPIEEYWEHRSQAIREIPSDVGPTRSAAASSDKWGPHPWRKIKKKSEVECTSCHALSPQSEAFLRVGQTHRRKKERDTGKRAMNANEERDAHADAARELFILCRRCLFHTLLQIQY
ncbi:hypothetical protein ACLOJK_013012 [Asimina triloba]